MEPGRAECSQPSEALPLLCVGHSGWARELGVLAGPSGCCGLGCKDENPPR